MRKILFYKSFFQDFYIGQSLKVQQKIDYVLKLIVSVKKVPEKFLKHISGTKGLYEIRVDYGGNIFRIFCFFDRENVLILLHGFQKKTYKIPLKELKRAERLREEYYEEKS
jgi:phage-related protein